MGFIPLKYFEGLKCIQSHLHTQSIAFFEWVLFLRSTLKDWNAFEVTFTPNPLLSSDGFYSFKVLQRTEMHSKSLTHPINCFLWMGFIPLKYFEGLKCIQRTYQEHTNIYQLTGCDFADAVFVWHLGVQIAIHVQVELLGPALEVILLVLVHVPLVFMQHFPIAQIIYKKLALVFPRKIQLTKAGFLYLWHNKIIQRIVHCLLLLHHLWWQKTQKCPYLNNCKSDLHTLFSLEVLPRGETPSMTDVCSMAEMKALDPSFQWKKHV